MTPQIGDPVVVRYLVPKPRIHGLVLQGQKPTVETVAGTLGAEVNAEGHVVGIVVETDGGATYIRPHNLVGMELDR